MRDPPGFKHHQSVRLLRLEASKEDGCPLCSMIWKAVSSKDSAAHLSENSEEHSRDESSEEHLSDDSPEEHLSNDSSEEHSTDKRLEEGMNDDDSIRLFLDPPGRAVPSDPHSETPPILLEEVHIFCGKAEDLDRMKWVVAPGNSPEVGKWTTRDEFDAEAWTGVEARLRFYGHNGIFTLNISLIYCNITQRSSGDPSVDLFRFKHTITDPASEEMFALINTWIQNCESSHGGCTAMTSRTTPLPSRVIDVGPADGSQNPYLLGVTNQHERQVKPLSKPLLGGTPSLSQRYVALSYCWGNESTLTTTQKNIRSMEKEIEMNSLPATIRDAVIITRKLGIRYLWVDALCILQGSDDASRSDWERESSKMADVYSGAYLTIAAALATSSHRGIFAERMCPRVPHVALPYSATCTPGVRGQVSLGFRVEKYNILHQPLYLRAWTLQERLLSRRVLIYATDQLVWECQSTVLTESGEQPGAIASTRLNADFNAIDWPTIIRDYCARHLTYENDKLPALSGLANAIYQRPGDQYLAGLWKGSFLQDLLWAHEHMFFENKTPRSRPKVYRAPSWSWASLNGNVYFPGLYLERTEYSTLLDYQVVASGENQFGQVTSGFIVLKGRAKQGCVNGDAIFELTSDVESEEVAPMWVDMGAATAFNPQNVWCLRILGDYGLVLTGLRGEKPNYRRIGMFVLNDKGEAWFSSSEDRTFTII